MVFMTLRYNFHKIIMCLSLSPSLIEGIVKKTVTIFIILVKDYFSVVHDCLFNKKKKRRGNKKKVIKIIVVLRKDRL